MSSAFSAKVYRVTKKIPAGRVATYAAIARAIGMPQAARAVGNALHSNPFAPQVPCHRVVRSDGSIGGFADGPAKKARLLKEEGVPCPGGIIDLLAYKYEFKVKK